MPIDKYNNNFIKGIKMMIASNGLKSKGEAANFLGMTEIALYKVMDRTNRPTVEHGITLCEKAGYSANWLFLDKGDMRLANQITLDGIMNELESLKKEIRTLKPQ